jgi:uncharacterized membrane protein
MIDDEKNIGQFGLPTNRLEVFSDGVIAIVITLLVLDFSSEEHNLAELAQQSSGAVLAELYKFWPHLLGYVMSFGLISVSWITHHFIFQYIRRSDLSLLGLNLFFLMSLAFLPFPTGLLADCIGHTSNVLVVFYGASHLVVSLSLLGIWLYAASNKRLIFPDVTKLLSRKITWTVASRPILYSIGIALSFLSVYAAIVLFAITPVIFFGIGIWKGLWGFCVETPGQPCHAKALG